VQLGGPSPQIRFVQGLDLVNRNPERVEELAFRLAFPGPLELAQDRVLEAHNVHAHPGHIRHPPAGELFDAEGSVFANHQVEFVAGTEVDDVEQRSSFEGLGCVVTVDIVATVRGGADETFEPLRIRVNNQIDVLCGSGPAVVGAGYRSSDYIRDLRLF
jgi:hypothetical protein